MPQELNYYDAINDCVVTRKMQLRNNVAIQYRQFEYSNNRKRKVLPQCFSIKKPATYSGQVSASSQKNIRRAVVLLVCASPKRIIYNSVLKVHHEFQLAFITLTLSNNDRYVNGKEAYNNLLAPFISWLRKTKKINTYIWKAERQKPKDKFGNIKLSHGQLHYHITIPNFIPLSEIKEKWNYLQNKSGYLETYFENYGNRNPNSIDVHSVIKVNDIESYLVKYISKMAYTHLIDKGILVALPLNDKKNIIVPKTLKEGQRLVYAIEINGVLQEVNNSIEGKVWDCSVNLKGVKYHTLTMNSHNENMVNYYIHNDIMQVIDKESCRIMLLEKEYVPYLMTIEQWSNYVTWKKELANTIAVQ